MTVSVAIPSVAVTESSPVTVPVPLVLAKVTTLESSSVTVLPAASTTVAVSVWVAPETFDPDSTSSSATAAPGRIV